jgi:hypothetical protein
MSLQPCDTVLDVPNNETTHQAGNLHLMSKEGGRLLGGGVVGECEY